MQKNKIVIINMTITTLYQLLVILFGFLIPRSFLIEYGANIHGLISTATNILSYVQILNAGLLSASVQALYKPLSLGEKSSVSSVLNAVKKYYQKVGFSYIIAILVIAIILPVFVSSEVPSITVFLVMTVMGLSSIFDSFLGSKYRVLVQADQKYWLISLCSMLSLTLKSIFQLFLIYFHCSIVTVQFIPALMTVMTYIILKIYVRKNYQYLNSKDKPDYSALGQRKAAMVHQVAGIVVNNTATLLLTIFEDLTVVSIYSVYQMVFTHLYTLLTNLFSTSTVASFGHMLVAEPLERVRAIFDKYEALFYGVMSIVLGTAAIMITPFIELYTECVKSISYSDIKLVILFVTIAILNSGRVPGVMLINAAGHYQKTQYRALIEAGSNLGISLILIQFIGIYGVLLGTIISFIYRTFDILIYSNKYILKRSPLRSIRRFLRTIIILIASCGMVQFIDINTSDTLIHWVLGAVISVVISSSITFLIWLLMERTALFDIFRYININYLQRK